MDVTGEVPLVLGLGPGDGALGAHGAWSHRLSDSAAVVVADTEVVVVNANNAVDTNARNATGRARASSGGRHGKRDGAGAGAGVLGLLWLLGLCGLGGDGSLADGAGVGTAGGGWWSSAGLEGGGWLRGSRSITSGVSGGGGGWLGWSGSGGAGLWLWLRSASGVTARRASFWGLDGIVGSRGDAHVGRHDLLHGVLARVGKTDVGHLGSPASATPDGSEVGNEHGRKGLETRGVVGTTLDVDGGAVHVHLTVADRVEPGPSKSGLTGFDALWDGEAESVDTVVAVGLCVAALPRATVATTWTLVAIGEVTPGVGGAATLDGVEHPPAVGVLELGRVGLVGDGDLAGSATVDSGVLVGSAGVEDQILLGTDGHVDTASTGRSDAVARKIGAGGVERVLDRITLDRLGHLHEQVRRGRGEEGESRRSGGSVLHCDRVKVCKMNVRISPG